MTLSFLSAVWTMICAAPVVLCLVVPLILLDEHLKRRKLMRKELQTFLRFG